MIRNMLQQRLGKVLQPELVAKGITPKGSSGRRSASSIPVEMAGQNGWLTIGWKRRRTDRRSNARTRKVRLSNQLRDTADDSAIAEERQFIHWPLADPPPSAVSLEKTGAYGP